MPAFAADLAALKPGDGVLIRVGYGYASYSAGTVARLTATQVIVACGGREMRFSKGRDFRLVGDRDGRTRLVEASEHFIRDYREQQAGKVFNRAAGMSGPAILARLGWERVEELGRLLGEG